MKRQGKIVEWNDARGFGFVVQNGGDERTFAHISDFDNRRVRPAIGQVITYTLVQERGRPKATAIRHAGAVAASLQRHGNPRNHRRSGSPWLGAALLIALVAGAYWYHSQDRERRIGNERAHMAAAAGEKSPQVQRFQCTGKKHCSQMNSCAEARFYIQECPDTRMDGDGDGQPCEDRCR